jgi:hypothetical protein
MCFKKTSVQTPPRQHSRHSLVGLDFATIIVEHGNARPHRRIGCCINCNPIVFSLTNKASNNLITATVAISTARNRSCELDVPDLPDFQSLFLCHRSSYLPQVALPDLPWRQRHRRVDANPHGTGDRQRHLRCHRAARQRSADNPG